MRILPVNNIEKKYNSKQNVNFKAKKSPEIVNKELAAKSKSITDFFKDPKNIEIIEENKRYSQEVQEFINENIHVKQDVMDTPFGPIGGKWPHEKI